MPSEDFKNNAEGLFAYAKIIGLIVAAGWTYYQWDKTIFPKESFDESLRASAVRIDINVQDQKFVLGGLVHDEMRDIEGLEAEEQARAIEGTPTLIQMSATLFNDRPFPVSFALIDASLRIAHVPPSGDELHWQKAKPIDIRSVFGLMPNEKRVLEHGGSAVISGQHVTAVAWCCPEQASKHVRLVEVTINLELQGISPQSSLPIPSATKRRRLSFVAVLTEDKSMLADMRLGAANGLSGWAMTPPFGGMFDPSMFEG